MRRILGHTFKGINYLLIFCLVLTAIGVAYISIPVFGNQSLIVRSGSMTPTIDVGSIVVIHPQEKSASSKNIPMYKNNDIVAFRSAKNSKTIITHRIVGIESGPDGVFYKTKGDANEEVDGWSIDSGNVLGKVSFSIPYAGKVLEFAKSDVGFPTLIIFPAAVVILLELLSIIKEIRKNRKKNNDHQADTHQSSFSSAKLHILIPLVIIGLVLIIPTTLAMYVDTETSTGNVFQAATDFGVTGTPTPTPEIDSTPTPTPTPENIATHIVISEVQTATSSSTLGDFIELYNPSSSPIALTGHRLVKRTGSSADVEIKAFSSLDIIPANGYYLWASSDNGYAIQIGANASTSQNIAADNSVALRNGAVDSGAIVDAVGFGTPTDITPLTETTAFTPSPPAGQSIERKALSTSDATSMSGVDAAKGNGYDTDNNATDFILRPISQPQNSSSAPESP